MTDVLDLQDVSGLELSAVCFVRNFVEFHFDGPVLRSLASPTVERGGQSVRYPDAGSRDALCELIGLPAQAVADGSEEITIEFPGPRAVRIPKRDPDAGPEIAHLVPMINGKREAGAMVVWENLFPSR